MRRFHSTLAMAVIVGAVIALSLGSPVQAQTATFRATPTSGPPGTGIAVASVTPCVLPAGVTGAPFARVTLTRGSTVITAGRFPVSASGAWSGTLTVGSQAALGADTLQAFCIASPQAEGALLAYAAVPFTVTASSGLPSTGFNPWPGTIASAGLLIAGAWMVLAARRRRTVDHRVAR